MVGMRAGCLVFLVVVFGDKDVKVQKPKTYQGQLTRACIKTYHRVFETEGPPVRTYKYYHEVIEESNNNIEQARRSEIGWRIVGGKTVDIEEVPYQVLYGEYCGGTLIAPDWVITAAHCHEKETYIKAGSTYRSQAQKYPICAHFTHPKWTEPNKIHVHDFDYQLVLLEQPVPVTPSSRPIAIGSLDEIVPAAMVCVSGWGHLMYQKSRMQEILNRVFVPIIPDDVCKAVPNPNYHTITPRMFCAGYTNGTKDSCQGDSGGPVVLNGKLIGLVSFGVGCAMPDRPGVYTIIPTAREWIRSITGLPLEKETYIKAGSTYRSQAQKYPICAHFTHPKWTEPNKIHVHDFDYQLVLLEQPVPVTPSSRPIAIGSLDEIVPAAMVCVSGWGHLMYQKSRMQEILNRVFVPIIPDDVCKAVPNPNYHTITPRMFCAGYTNGTKDSCQGDSGGPVVLNGKLIGLVSFGVGCAMPDRPGVYTIIPTAREWIRSITGLPL